MERIPDHVKRYVEGELREYRTLKAELEQLKQDKADIYNRFNQPKGEPVKGSHPGDPTSAAAVRLETISRKAANIERKIKKIENGLDNCSTEEKKLIRFRYFSVHEPTDEETIYYLYYGYRNKYFKTKFKS